MADSSESNGKNGHKTIVIAVIISVTSTLIASGIVGGILMFSRLSAFEANQQATNAVIQSLHQRLAKIEGDVYAPRFGRSSRSSNPIRAGIDGPATATP